MASVIRDSDGTTRIEVNVPGREKRQTIRLGRVTGKQADAFATKVESLVNASILGSMDDETAHWLAKLDEKLRRKVEHAGLVTPQVRSNVTLGKMLDEFFASISVKSGTETTYRQTRKSLVNFFGEDKPLRSIEPLDADKWRQSMKAAELADATISKRVKTARQAFKRAVRWKMITDNPLVGVVGGSQANDSRQYFLPREDAARIADACPDIQWRVIFALSRYGGLRCPSETLTLKWADVDWDKGRVRVTSPKTEHQGKGSRWLPLFPELRGPLLEAFEAAETGTEYVITRYRDQKSNLRTQFERIIKRAGLTPWSRLFHNLRATRQTELSEVYPAHVVCDWLGNSERIARDHYLQTLDSHFSHAAQDGSNKTAVKSAVVSSELARTTSQKQTPEMQNPPEKPGDSAPYESVREMLVTPTGFEPVSRP
jgi:integrase